MKLDKQYTIKYSDFISNFFYQQIAFYITTFLVKTKITPNNITILSLLTGILSAFSLYIGYLYLSIFLLNISFIFDCIDGQIARAKKLHSDFGMWLDNITDRVVENIILIAMSFVLIYNNFFLMGIVLLIFFNMYYAYISDMLIYSNTQGYKRLTKIEKILFAPIYFISRSMMIPMLSLFILYPLYMVWILIFLYLYGIIFRIYREVTK